MKVFSPSSQTTTSLIFIIFFSPSRVGHAVLKLVTDETKNGEALIVTLAGDEYMKLPQLAATDKIII